MLAWSDDYKIGHPELDAQHLMLFALINQLDINIGTGKADQMLDDVMGALTCYIDYHFVTEEGLMRQAGYPQANSHRDLHRTLMEKVEAMSQAAAATTDPLGHALKTRTFVIDWLVEHIMEDDARFVAFLARRREASFAAG